ncbi:MAG: beta-propeller domain-containing protein [Proteocatella sp.]
MRFLKQFSAVICVVAIFSSFAYAEEIPDSLVSKGTICSQLAKLDYKKPILVQVKKEIKNPENEIKMVSQKGSELPTIINKLKDRTYLVIPVNIYTQAELKFSDAYNIYRVSNYSGEVYVGSTVNLKKILEKSNRGLYPWRSNLDIVQSPEAPMGETSKMEDSSSLPNPGYSQTNLQVEGVDEADIVKTDGKYIYYVKDNIIYIAETDKGKLVQRNKIDAGTDFYVIEIYIDLSADQKSKSMVMIGREYKNSKTYSKAVVYDITDVTKAKEKRSFSQEGNYISSRKIGKNFHMVTEFHFGYYGKGVAMPVYRDTAVSSLEINMEPKDIMIFPPYLGGTLVSINSFDIDSNVKAQRVNYLGNAQNLYMANDSMYVSYLNSDFLYYPMFAEPKIEASGDVLNETIDIMPPIEYREKTIIKKFDVKDTSIKYSSEASIEGTLINQFAMDQSSGYFRVAYTKDQSSGSMVSVFDKTMKEVGKLSGIAPGEKIYSVRFMGDKLYLVTFKQIDPFFVIDVSKPELPKILGYLKIPGYSDYLHSYDENHILGFGKAVTVTGENIRDAGMKIAMFDVTDFSNPKQISSVIIGSMGTNSEVLHNHKALMYNREKNYLGFPITVAQAKRGPDNYFYSDYVFQGGYVYDIKDDYMLQFKGSMTHIPSGTYNYENQNYINRLVYIGDYIYSLSSKGISANKAENMQRVSMILWK